MSDNKGYKSFMPYINMNSYGFTAAISAVTIGIAAIPAEILTLPICAIRTNYMANVKSIIKDNSLSDSERKIPKVSIRQVTMNIYNQRGLYGFFNATAPAVMSQILSSSSKYTMYEGFKHYYGNGDNNFGKNALFGTISGVSGGLITAPFDRARALRQHNDGPTTRSFGSIGRLYLSNPMEAWKGYSFSFGKNVVLYSTLYPGYDLIKSYNNGNPVVASFIAPLIISGILQPIEFARTRHMLGLEWKMGWNPRPYYTGYTLTAGRAIPHFMITMCTMEYVKVMVQKHLGITVKK